MVDISFVIPAHNAGKTLVRTVNSIINCMTDCEIIVVENGSTDNTKDVLNNLCANNNMVRAFYTEKGVSRARNEGIKQAKGKWICFVDADDEWIGTEKIIKVLLSKYSEVDFIMGSYYKDADLIIHDYSNTESLITGEEIIPAFSWIISKPTLRTEVWSKIFNKKFLLENNIVFDESLTHSEDAEFIIKVLEKSKRIMISQEVFYKFSSGTPSTMRSIDYKKTDAYISALTSINRRRILHCDNLEEGYRNFIVSHLNLIAVHEIFNCQIRLSWKERIRHIKSIIRNDIFSEAVDKISISDVRDPFLIPAFLYKHHFFTLGGIICNLRSRANMRRYRKYKYEKGVIDEK